MYRISTPYRATKEVNAILRGTLEATPAENSAATILREIYSHRYISAGIIMKSISKFFGVEYSDSLSTNSSYCRIGKYEVRVSDHAKGVWYGSRSRANTAYSIEISTAWTRAKMLQKLSSIINLVGNA